MQNIQNGFKELLQKEMTRKEFLGFMGLAVASVMGFDKIVNALTTKASAVSAPKLSGSAKQGYGK